MTTLPLSEQFQTIRLDQGLEQQHVAAAIGVSPGALRGWERGVKSPGVHNAIALTENLGHRLVVRRRHAVICEVGNLLPDLTRFREAHKLTRSQMARHLYMTPERVSTIEHSLDRGVSMRVTTLQRYLSGLGDYTVDVVPAEAVTG